MALSKISLVDEFISLSEQVQSDVFRISVLRFMNLPDTEIEPFAQRLQQGLSDLNVIYGQILTKWPAGCERKSHPERHEVADGCIHVSSTPSRR